MSEEYPPVKEDKKVVDAARRLFPRDIQTLISKVRSTSARARLVSDVTVPGSATESMMAKINVTAQDPEDDLDEGHDG